MAFCVECGRDGPTLEGLCEVDFRRKHTLVTAAEYMDVVQCAHCAKLQIGSSWMSATLEDVMLDLIPMHARRDPHVSKARYTYDLRPQDERNVAVTVKAVCTVGPWEIVDSFHSRVRVHIGQCPTCSRQKGKFFVGTVQVRAEGRELTDDEVREARGLVERAPTGRDFVSRVEEVRGGLDVRVSTNAFAKRLARDLAKALGGAVASSATLQTQKQGKEQYRATYRVRIAGFREGDTIAWRRGRYRVVSVGETVRLEDPRTGERLRVKVRELKGARVARD